MDELLEEAIEDMKGSLRRADHSYYVSLKYSRTVDVIRNLLERYVTTLCYMMNALLEYKRFKGEIESVSTTLIERVGQVRELFPEEEDIVESLDFLLFLRKVLRAEHGKCEEFRRHVTMIVKVEGEEYHIDIDLLGEYYESIKSIINRAIRVVEELPDDDN